jgi:hypothetical protein
MDESSFSKSDAFSPSSQELEKKPLLDDTAAAAVATGSHMPPAPLQGQSTQVQPKLGRARERLWSTVLFVMIASLPALLVGCTLAFPSIALLDLSELEERPDYKLSTLLSDVFGVRTIIIIMCAYNRHDQCLKPSHEDVLDHRRFYACVFIGHHLATKVFIG